MEAFIDFSEDELIEDGVLNQGVCVCTFVLCGSPLGFKSGGEEGVGRSVGGSVYFTTNYPKKHFPVGGEERSDGQIVVGPTLKA